MNRRDMFKAFAGIPIGTAVTRIAADEIRPSDVILVEVPGKIDPVQAKYIIEALQRTFPGQKCLVLEQGMTLKFVEKLRVDDGK